MSSNTFPRGLLKVLPVHKSSVPKGVLVNGILNCYYANAKSLKNKLADLHDVLYDNRVSYDCLFFTESWLCNSMSDGILDPQNNYFVIRKDRLAGTGGGVCAFVSKKFQCVPVAVPSSSVDIDLICFDIITKSRKIRFILFYRPPVAGDLGRLSAEFLRAALDQLIITMCPTFILTDLNCPNID